jgi:hypothetical protein
VISLISIISEIRKWDLSFNFIISSLI